MASHDNRDRDGGDVQSKRSRIFYVNEPMIFLHFPGAEAFQKWQYLL
jgi:hypothetical protein